MPKRRSRWWIALLVVGLVPATLIAGKQGYRARIVDGGRAVGAAMMVTNASGADYDVQARPAGVETVLLYPTGGAWSMTLCSGDECTYVYNPNLQQDVLTIGGTIGAPALNAIGLKGHEFLDLLQSCSIHVALLDDASQSLGVGTFVQFYPDAPGCP